MISRDSFPQITADLTLDLLLFSLVSDPFNFLNDADNRPGLGVHGCVSTRPDWSGSLSLDKSQEIPSRKRLCVD
jgi:hypothetical protein